MTNTEDNLIFCLFVCLFVCLSGGRNGKYSVQCLEVLDLKQSKWTKLKPITKPRVFCSYIMTDEKFYCIGGLQADGKDFHDDTEEYDVENGT